MSNNNKTQIHWQRFHGLPLYLAKVKNKNTFLVSTTRFAELIVEGREGRVLQEQIMFDNQYLCDHTVAIFPTRDQAEGAIRFLQNSGHEITHLSMIGKSAHNTDTELDSKTESNNPLLFVYPISGSFKFGGWMSEFPDIALLPPREPAIGKALSRIGIPTESAGKYVDALEAGSYIIFVHATSNELRRVKESLANTSATSVRSFSTRGAVRTFGVPLCELPS